MNTLIWIILGAMGVVLAFVVWEVYKQHKTLDTLNRTLLALLQAQELRKDIYDTGQQLLLAHSALLQKHSDTLRSLKLPEAPPDLNLKEYDQPMEDEDG